MSDTPEGTYPKPEHGWTCFWCGELFTDYYAARKHFGKYPNHHKNKIENLERELAAAQARLPEGMKECTILFKECAAGHGWLTATNWVQHDCSQCKLDAAQQAIEMQSSRIDWTVNDNVQKALTIEAQKKEIEELKGG